MFNLTPQQEADALLAIHQANRKNRSSPMSNTSDILTSIESKAGWIKDDAKSLAYFVDRLSVRRDFPTLAEAAMDEAERQLIDALKTVRESRKAFNSRPVEQSHAA